MVISTPRAMPPPLPQQLAIADGMCTLCGFIDGSHGALCPVLHMPVPVSDPLELSPNTIHTEESEDYHMEGITEEHYNWDDGWDQ